MSVAFEIPIQTEIEPCGFSRILSLLNRITIEPGKCGGKPSIRSMRIRVSDILELLGKGISFEQVLVDFPDFSAKISWPACNMRPYGLTSFALRHEILGRRSVTPAMATWLAERFKVEALSLRDIGLRDAPDMEIFLAAQQAGIVVISKDSDFVELVSRYGTPPQLVWVTCGNVSNRRL